VPFILLESNPYQTTHHIAERAVRGALLSIMTGWRIPVMLTKDSGETASILLQLGAQNLSRNISTAYINGNKPKSTEQMRSSFLCGLPQTGPVLAERLLSYFGNIESIMNADEEALQNIHGIGYTKSRTIRKFITDKLEI
jgi:ERCC4-type nuclease